MLSLLKDVSIVEGSAFVAAPLGGMTLAQLGADVIRFDAIGGGIDYKRMPLAKHSGNSLYWTGLNKGKRSFAVNIRDPRGQDLIRELIAKKKSDNGIFLTNLAVNWLAYEELKKSREDVIVAQLSGHHDGTNAVDYTVNNAVGFPYLTGKDKNTPSNHVLPAWDLVAGLMLSVGILSALRHRSATGKGQQIKLALSDVAYAMTSHLGYVAEAQINQDQRKADGNYLYGAFGRDFETADGKRVMILAITGKQWKAMCEAMELTDTMAQLEKMLGLDFKNEQQRFEAREFIAGFVERWCKARPLSEVAAKLDATATNWSQYRTMMEMVEEDPRCSTKNPMFQELDQPGIGKILAAGPALNFSAFPRENVKPAPVLGQHTDEILGADLGLSSSQIGELHDQGIVAGPVA